MKRFDSIIFDLDGTLWDTTPACAVAWNEVLATHQTPYRTIEAEDVRKVTGMPHDECIRLTFSDLPSEKVERLVVATAAADNEVIARMGGQLYPGVADGLLRLKERFPLFIVSNCQSGYIENFVAMSGFADMFLDFECFGNTYQSKAANLASVIRRNGLNEPLMVGDTSGDEDAARACGISFAFVSYGFGRANAPAFSFDSFADLVAFLAP